MIVIYDTRFYGRVDSHGGQHQLTKFFHIYYYVPLVPVGTLWVTRALDRGYNGHAVQMSGRSVVAGYVRVWGRSRRSARSRPAASAASSRRARRPRFWSWTWHSVRSTRAAA